MAKKAKLFIIISIVWFLVAAAIWIGLGYYFLNINSDQGIDKTGDQLLSTLAIIFIIFGIVAFVFLLLVVLAVYGPYKRDRYDAAYNRSLLLGGIGLFFGLGAGVMLIVAGRSYIKNHPKYMATLPVPTPICERCGQPVQFDKEVGGWYCPTCKIHLTKGVPKPKAPEKPVLPPPPPAYAPPQQAYQPQAAPPPKPMGPPPQYPPQPKPMAPPPPGYPPQPKPMAPPPGYAPPPAMAPPPKPMAPPPGYQPQALPPNTRVLACSRCGKTFQWTVTDPNQRMAKCPWCNNDLMIQ